MKRAIGSKFSKSGVLTMITSLLLSSGRFIQPLTLVPASLGLKVDLPLRTLKPRLAQDTSSREFSRVFFVGLVRPSDSVLPGNSG